MTICTKIRATLRRRLRDERGFTMLLALFVLVITTLILSGAYLAVLSDTHLSRNDLDQKRAYAGAQAGIQAYNYQLNQNENYWQTCTPLGTASSPITVPGSTDQGGGSESYYVTPLPASTAPASDPNCDSSNALATMIEGSSGAGSASGSFRIQSVGTSGNVSRTIVAQYKPPSFLNYVYYTDYETLDPSVTGDPASCEVHYPNRGSQCGGNSAPYGSIDFINGDTINGPLHTEDTLAICGNPVFGRPGAGDAIEAAAATGAPNGWYQDGCSGTPTFNTATGKVNTAATSITPPSTNTSLLSVAQSGGYVYTGATTIVLTNNTMSVTSPGTTNATNHPTGTNVPFPSNGVIYVSTVSSAGCGVSYTPFNPSYTNDGNCGNAYVSGTYTQSLTIATDNDIIIDGNICTTTTTTCSGAPTTNALLGLIADYFVRIYHPVDGTRQSSSGNCSSGARGAQDVTNDSGSLTNPTIYAAILAVSHSFIVDNYDCGSPLGTLTVYGAIAQLYRGTVGTQDNGNVASGYVKSYNYDDRLQNEEPPYFLDPVSAQWYVSRETECAASSSSC
jgi:Tfp pilus assembly protein PilX